MTTLLDVIEETACWLVLNKPAGLVCHPTKGDAYSSLISRIRLYLGAQTTPHLVNRLDRETSGIVLVAKERQIAAQLRRIWETRQVQKHYLAIVHGHVHAPRGFIDAPLGKDEQSQIAIKDRVRPDGAPAQTEFETEKRFTRNGLPFSLLRVVPKTGRKHQIRIHLAHVGHPIVGDKLYGGDENLYLDFVLERLTEAQQQRLIFPNQALHAALIRFEWQGLPTEFNAQPEPWFESFVAEAKFR